MQSMKFFQVNFVKILYQDNKLNLLYLGMEAHKILDKVV